VALGYRQEKRIMYIGPFIIVIVEEWKTKLMSLAILFHFLCVQQVPEINIYIIRSLRLFCWITTLVVLFLDRCVLEFWCGWVGVVSVLQGYQELTTILLNYHIAPIVLGSMCVGVSVWVVRSDIRVAVWSLQHGYHSNPTTPKLQHTSSQEQYDQCGNSTE